MDFHRARRFKHETPLTPLVDVLLFLIIFFMLTTSFVLSESIELTLPSASSKIADTRGTLQILIRDDGMLQVDDKLMTQDDLDQLLIKKLESNAETRILILSADHVTVQQLVTVMDLVYLSGGRNVQINYLSSAKQAS